MITAKTDVAIKAYRLPVLKVLSAWLKLIKDACSQLTCIHTAHSAMSGRGECVVGFIFCVFNIGRKHVQCSDPYMLALMLRCLQDLI